MTARRNRTPSTRPKAIRSSAKKRLGALETPGFRLTRAFDELLPEDELRLWNGEDSQGPITSGGKPGRRRSGKRT